MGVGSPRDAHLFLMYRISTIIVVNPFSFPSIATDGVVRSERARAAAHIRPLGFHLIYVQTPSPDQSRPERKRMLALAIPARINYGCFTLKHVADRVE